MKTNIMVCVTRQKTCDRLIEYGNELLSAGKGELFIIHVARYNFKFLGNNNDSDALEYLYEKAFDYGANLIVVRSNDIVDTIMDFINKNKITHLVLGISYEAYDENNIIEILINKLDGKVQVITVPAK